MYSICICGQECHRLHVEVRRQLWSFGSLCQSFWVRMRPLSQLNHIWSKLDFIGVHPRIGQQLPILGLSWVKESSLSSFLGTLLRNKITSSCKQVYRRETMELQGSTEKPQKASCGHHVIREGQEGQGRARIFSIPSQGHGFQEVMLQEVSSNSVLTVNEKIFLIMQLNNGSCLQNGVRQVHLLLLLCDNRFSALCSKHLYVLSYHTGLNLDFFALCLYLCCVIKY